MLGSLATFIDELGQYLVRGLAVAGGAAVGAVVTGLIAGFVIRRVFHKPQPPGVRALFRALGGVAGGLAVALLVFTGLGGKWGWGGGGDGVQSKGELGPTRTSATQPDAPRATESTAPGPRPPQSVRVVMLGGELVRNGAAYRVEGERQARTLSEVQELIRQRMAATPPAKSLDILVYDNSVARGSAPVEDLEAWGRQNGLTVTVVATPGDLPP